MTYTAVHIDDDVGIVEGDEEWGFSTPEVQVTFSAGAWWSVIKKLQEWLGECECQHCGNPVGNPPRTEIGEAG